MDAACANQSDIGGMSGRLSKRASRIILVPVDFTETSYMALSHAWVLAESLQASIALLHVVEPDCARGFLDTPRHRRVRKDIFQRARRRLDEMTSRSGVSRSVPVKKMVREGVPEFEISRVAERLNACLVVLGRHARHPLSRVIFGSVTRDVVDASPCPVLVVNNQPLGRTGSLSEIESGR